MYVDTCHLPSIYTPGEQVGYEAMALVDRLLDGQKPPRGPILVPATKLIVRQSTALTGDTWCNIDWALRLIRQRACERVRVGQVAKSLDVSRRRLEQEFVRAIGHTPGEEIRRVRIARAKELLCTTDHRIAEIAGMVGFERPANFSEFFRKHTGTSPRAYRQAYGRS